MGHAPLTHLAYDIGDGIGLGHRRRMEALATALRSLGHDTALDPLGQSPIDTPPIEAGPIEAGPIEADMVVVDSYRVDAERGSVGTGRVAAVDDLRRDLAVDLLIEPAPENGARPAARAGRVLRGLRYALLDPGLREREQTPVRDDVDTVVVTTGGTDKAGVGASMATAVRAALPSARVRLVVGSWSAAGVAAGVEVLREPADFAAELEAADVVVCSAGVTLLEALVLGRPVVAVATSANQRPYLDPLAAGGAVVAATPDGAAAEVVRLARDGAARRHLAVVGRETVDGRGAHRVAQAVAELL